MNFGSLWLTRMRSSPILMLTVVNKMFDVDQLPCRQGNRLNMTFCGPARDTLLSNQETEKLNFDTYYIAIRQEV